MEAFVWACTDSHLGVCVSTRVFGSVDEAKADAQEAIGDAVPIEWTATTKDGWVTGDFTDTNGCEGSVTVALVKTNL